MTCTFEMNLSKQILHGANSGFTQFTHTQTFTSFVEQVVPFLKTQVPLKNRAVLPVKTQDLASIGSKSPYLSDHEDDVKALGRQLFWLMGLRRFDSPFDRDVSLTFLYHPCMVNLPTFGRFFNGKCG